jgi:hypothetical protein
MLFKKALTLDPEAPGARAGLISTFYGEDLDPEQLDETERVVLRANILFEARDWEGIRELDAELARTRPGSLLFASAVRARVQWRISIGSVLDGADAIAIIDELLTRQRTPAHVFLRAAAAALAKDPKVAWASLEEIVSTKPPSQRLRRQSLALARELGEPPANSTVLQRLTGRRRTPR